MLRSPLGCRIFFVSALLCAESSSCERLGALVRELAVGGGSWSLLFAAVGVSGEEIRIGVVRVSKSELGHEYLNCVLENSARAFFLCVCRLYANHMCQKDCLNIS